MFEINHLRTVDINGEVSVLFLCKNLRAAKVIGSRYAVLGLRGSDSVGIVGKSRLFFLRSRVLPLPLLRFEELRLRFFLRFRGSPPKRMLRSTHFFLRKR